MSNAFLNCFLFREMSSENTQDNVTYIFCQGTYDTSRIHLIMSRRISFGCFNCLIVPFSVFIYLHVRLQDVRQIDGELPRILFSVSVLIICIRP